MTTMLDENTKKQVIDVMAGLDQPVNLIFFSSKVNNCEYCSDTKNLLEEIAGLSEKISIQAFDLESEAPLARKYRIDKAPGFTIVGQLGNDEADYGIRYFGIPAGHEFTSLINDIILVSRRDSGLASPTREALAKLDKPVQLKVFVTPSCPYCPRAVVLAHQMALESPMIEAEMVEAMEFEELANKFNVSGVPHTIINDGKAEVVGAVPEEHLLQKILQAAA
jgi:glutaredoxin-like protein